MQGHTTPHDAPMESFAQAHRGITYEQFDQLVLNELNLFDIPKEDYFERIEAALDRIIRALPAIKRVFARPIIRLRDTQEILPVEMTKIIDSHTLAHASIHTELWGDIVDGEVHPKKLLTVGRTETYVVYENIILTRVVDSVLALLARTKLLLKDVLYDYSDVHFNLLDLTYHSAFFFAIGKLRLEYVRAQKDRSQSYERCVEKIGLIERTLRPKLRTPLYLQCKKRKGALALKKSNAFRLHKDYGQVYKLALWLNGDPQAEGPDVKDTHPSLVETGEEYRVFCSLLSVFAVGHFNFTFPEAQRLDFTCLNASCEYVSWRLKMKAVSFEGINGLLFTFQKDGEYGICTIFGEKKKLTVASLEAFKAQVGANEYCFANASSYGEPDVLYLSLFNVDSFRRIQQMLLRGMIFSDTARDICPFCGRPLHREEEAYDCHFCRGRIEECVCPVTGEAYVTSTIQHFESVLGHSAAQQEKRKFLHDRYVEAQMHFRNITPTTQGGALVCPKCGGVHNPPMGKE